MEEKQFSLQNIFYDLQTHFDREKSANILVKCTRSCFLSMQEKDLLPTEERCLRNCYAKSFDFHEFMEKELKYTLRNTQWFCQRPSR